MNSELALTNAELDRAVTQLVSESVILTDQGYARQSGLYAEMVSNPPRAIIAGIGGSGASKSAPPMRLDALDWVSDVDQAAREWHPVGKSTPDRLTRLVDDGWRHQDIPEMRRIIRRIKGFVNAAEAYLNDRHSFTVAAPCPECGQWWADDHGVRRAALTVNEDGANCAACGEYWPSTLFTKLAALIDN